VSYFTLRTIIVLMETMKDFYSSTTIPPSAAVATRRCDLRVNEYAAQVITVPFRHLHGQASRIASTARARKSSCIRSGRASTYVTATRAL
jgi:hypothetical protein